jgi:hypothetical protein
VKLNRWQRKSEFPEVNCRYGFAGCSSDFMQRITAPPCAGAPATSPGNLHHSGGKRKGCVCGPAISFIHFSVSAEKCRFLGRLQRSRLRRQQFRSRMEQKTDKGALVNGRFAPKNRTFLKCILTHCRLAVSAAAGRSARGQPQHGAAEVVILGEIAIDGNTVDLVVADDGLNEQITAMPNVGNPAP